MIVVHHVVGINQMKLPPELAFIPAYFGYGVPLFFVISAFSLFYTYANRMNSVADIKAYFVRRFARIAPLFYTMIVVWVLTSHYKLLQKINPAEVLANLTFIFNLTPPWRFSIVWAGWSIGVEFLFYAFVPLAIAMVRDVRSSVLALAFSIAAVWSFQGTPGTDNVVSLLMYGPFFVMGMFAWNVFKKNTAQQARRALSWFCICAAAAIFALVTMPQHWLSVIPYDRTEFFMWGVAFTLVVYSQAIHPFAWISNRVTGFLGEISFSLYLLHPWIILMCKPMYVMLEKLSPELYFTTAVLYTFAIVIPVAYGTYRLIEKPGIAFGKRLTSRKTESLPEMAPRTAPAAIS